MSNNYEELARRAKMVNQQIIEEFHANGGKVGDLPGATFLLLHTRGDLAPPLWGRESFG